MKPLILWLIAICALTLAVATCGDDDDDDSSDASNDDDADDDNDTDDDTDNDDDDVMDDDADDDTQAECNTWTDAASGLTWTTDPVETSSAVLGWSEATDYCESLVCDGHDDWRLPTISELRSLVRGCSSTEYGGSCAVTDDCLYGDDCFVNGCSGCGTGNGPHEGCYWPDEMTGECPILWSSSPLPPGVESHWYVALWQAGLGTSVEGFSVSDARCARGEF